MCVCVCVCVCVCERERETVCVFVCVCLSRVLQACNEIIYHNPKNTQKRQSYKFTLNSMHNVFTLNNIIAFYFSFIIAQNKLLFVEEKSWVVYSMLRLSRVK